MKNPNLCQSKSGETSRNSNIELYRIISMLLIVAHHYVVNSGLLVANGPILSNIWSFPSQFLLLFGAFGKIGINCFIFITGYFMCKSNITAKKFVKLLFEVMFYKIVIFLVFSLSGYAPITLKSLLVALVPFSTISQNFTGTYLVFFLCIPFLNILIHHLTEKQHVLLLLLTSTVYIVFGSVPMLSVTMNYVSWYMTLYVIASYIRLYPKKIYQNTRFWGFAALCCLILSLLSVVACSFIGVKLDRFMSFAFVADSNKVLAVLMALSSFMFFQNLNIKQSKGINLISATTFGVFMIHANSDTMRQWLWQDVCDNVGVYHSAWMPLHAISCVVIIFVVCSLIDMLRIRWIEKPFFSFWDKHYPDWAKKYTEVEEKLLKKLKIGESQNEG